MIHIYPGALAISALFSTHGYRKGSLDASGYAAAFVVGYLSLANDLKCFGVLLLAFYFAGSRATKVKAELKSKLEEGHEPQKDPTNPSHLAGHRNAVQVLCNSLLGVIAAVLYRYVYGDLTNVPSTTPTCLLVDLESRQMITLATYFYAACMGDTLASELGMLAAAQPRMLSTFRVVPPGTNGGVTWWGTLMSLAGGAFVGSVALLDLFLEDKLCLAAEPRSAAQLLLFATLAGGLGSAYDSFLGALFQQTLYSTKQQKVVKTALATDPGIESIGGSDIFSNDHVNLMSTLTVAWNLVRIDQLLLKQ